MKNDDCKHEEAKLLNQEDREYVRGVATSAMNSWKNRQTLRYKKFIEVSHRTEELIQKACNEGKEMTPELEQKIIEQVYKEFGI